ncbi:MAG TPA: transglutaminase domain-containing protein [Thermoleophilia bacterium]|nr:transglutaminase domain-containing protein [Thermoleophilia bacterium]
MRFTRGAIAFLMLLWVLVVLYPDPTVLVTSVQNLLRPEADATAAAKLARQLPDDPREIEAEVLQRVSYATDWEVHGVPWRFPTAAEAVAEARGDCEARALVLMSVLEAKGIPHALRNSINHMWVDYPGKVPTASENDALVLADREGGRLKLRLPEDLDLWREIESKIELFWDPMPWSRRILLAAGLLLIPLGARVGSSAPSGRAGSPSCAQVGGLRRRRTVSARVARWPSDA